MAEVIHQYGRAMKAKLPNGIIVNREDFIYVPSYRNRFPVLPYDSHFIYYNDRYMIGSTLMCTCGSYAEIVGYQAYEKYNSFIGNSVIACSHYTREGKHSDGSL